MVSGIDPVELALATALARAGAAGQWAAVKVLAGEIGRAGPHGAWRTSLQLDPASAAEAKQRT